MADNFDMSVRTSVATALADEEASVTAYHDEVQNESSFQAVGGAILITPSNRSLPPILLPENATVVVTAASIGDPLLQTHSYLPYIVEFR